MESVVGPWSLIDLAVIGAVGAILPACLGHRWLWSMAAVAVTLSCAAETQSVGAMVLASVWPAVGLVVLARLALEGGPLPFWSREHLVAVLAAGSGLVAASWFVMSRAGVSALGIHEPIVALTAVHFTYVGVAALVLADAALARCHGRIDRVVGRWALALTAAAPAVVAAGFATGSAWPQIGGAVLVSLGVFCTAALQLQAAATRRARAVVRMALGISGLSIWVPMVLAVSWATSRYYDVPALSTADMVHTHGAVNAVGFVAAGLLARHLELGATAPGPNRAQRRSTARRASTAMSSPGSSSANPSASASIERARSRAERPLP